MNGRSGSCRAAKPFTVNIKEYVVDGANGYGRRLLRVTPGNIRNSHLYVREHYDFFPANCVGPSRRRSNGVCRDIELVLDGLNEVVKTDIGASAKTGKPRGFFRGRQWVRRFFKCHEVRAGDLLALDRLEPQRYRLSMARRGLNDGNSFTATEFFSGIGLVRLALERHGWQVALRAKKSFLRGFEHCCSNSIRDLLTLTEFRDHAFT